MLKGTLLYLAQNDVLRNFVIHNPAARTFARRVVAREKLDVAILDRIKQTGVDANISIKLTALGLDISQEVCEQNVCHILEQAQKFPIFVRIDMEGSAYTEQTVDITLRMHKRFEHVGTVIQS